MNTPCWQLPRPTNSAAGTICKDKMLSRTAAGGAHPCLGADPVALAQQLHGQDSGHASHGPAGVNQLSLLEPAADVCWGGQTCRAGTGVER